MDLLIDLLIDLSVVDRLILLSIKRLVYSLIGRLFDYVIDQFVGLIDCLIYFSIDQLVNLLND